MSVHDYFKPFAPKHSKKQVWEISLKPPKPSILLPKLSQQKKFDLRNSVSIISFPTNPSAKVQKKSELIVKPESNPKVFRITRRLLRKSGVKTDLQPSLSTTSLKSKLKVFELDEFRVVPMRIFQEKECRTTDDRELELNSVDENEEEGEEEHKLFFRPMQMELPRVNTLPYEKIEKMTDINRRRFTCVKESLSLPSINNEEFELKGW